MGRGLSGGRGQPWRAAARRGSTPGSCECGDRGRVGGGGSPGSADGPCRRRYVLGGGARRLSGAWVLVSGLRGTGAQVAAALVLAGTGRVVLHDRGTACTADRAQQVPVGPGGAGGELGYGHGCGQGSR